MSSTMAEKVIAAARTGEGPKKRPPPPLKRGAKSLYRKVALYGPIGTGKTLALAYLIELGERLFGWVTDEGLVTIENYLRGVGLEERFDTHLMYLDATDYKVASDTMANLDEYYGDALRDFRPTVKFWDGFSVFQLNQIDYEVMPDKLRPKKLFDPTGGELPESMDPFEYWDKVRRATTRAHTKFLHATYAGNPGWHKILTAHQNEEKDKKGNPLGVFRASIMGAARNAVMAEYDLVINTSLEDKMRMADGKITTASEYTYKLKGTSTKVEVKNRGFDLPAEMPADFREVWKVIARSL